MSFPKRNLEREREVVKSKLTICNCSGDSAWTKLSLGDISVPHPDSLTWDDTAGIKSCISASTFGEQACDAGIESCTSASTGGGEGCLIIFGWDCVVSNEIREEGSSAQCIWVSSFEVRVDSCLDFSCPKLLQSSLIASPSSMVFCRLFSQKGTQMKHMSYRLFKSINKGISWRENQWQDSIFKQIKFLSTIKQCLCRKYLFIFPCELRFDLSRGAQKPK